MVHLSMIPIPASVFLLDCTSGLGEIKRRFLFEYHLEVGKCSMIPFWGIPEGQRALEPQAVYLAVYTERKMTEYALIHQSIEWSQWFGWS